MNISKRILYILIISLGIFLSFAINSNDVFAQSGYPYCSNGLCVTGVSVQCVLQGTCVYPAGGYCNYHGGGSGVNCNIYEYGGSCSQDCDCDNSCDGGGGGNGGTCPSATCSMLNPPVTELIWYDSCPSSNCQNREVQIEIIPSAPSGCPTSGTRICYVENTPPEPPDPDNPLNDLQIEIVPGDFTFILQSKIRDIGNDLITGISNFISKIFDIGWV